MDLRIAKLVGILTSSLGVYLDTFHDTKRRLFANSELLENQTCIAELMFRALGSQARPTNLESL